MSEKLEPEQVTEIMNKALTIQADAVKECGGALEYVKEQTPEICIAAVRETRYALEHIKFDKLDEQQSREIRIVYEEHPPKFRPLFLGMLPLYPSLGIY